VGQHNAKANGQRFDEGLRLEHTIAPNVLEHAFPADARNRMKPELDVFAYIELFYSLRRRHSTLGQVSPDQFKKATRSFG